MEGFQTDMPRRTWQRLRQCSACGWCALYVSGQPSWQQHCAHRSDYERCALYLSEQIEWHHHARCSGLWSFALYLGGQQGLLRCCIAGRPPASDGSLPETPAYFHTWSFSTAATFLRVRRLCRHAAGETSAVCSRCSLRAAICGKDSASRCAGSTGADCTTLSTHLSP